MAQVETHGAPGTGPATTPMERKRLVAAGGGGVAEAIAAIAAVVLSIVGLAGGTPGYMLTIAIIALGASFLFEGAAVAARYSTLLSETHEHQHAEVGSGIAAEAVAGVAGIALGILALLGISPLTLAAIAVIVFGGAMLLGGGAHARLNALRPAYAAGDVTQRVAQEAVFVTSGGQILIGIGAIVLGILALLGMSPLMLALIATLGIGGSMLLSGTAIGTRMLSVLHHF